MGSEGNKINSKKGRAREVEDEEVWNKGERGRELTYECMNV